MKKWVCSVCGYVFTGEQPPSACPQCKAPASKFAEQKAGGDFAAVHAVGVAKNVEQDIKDDLRAHFNGECCEVGMYLAMARVAEREGYPEIAEAYKRYAYEEADHASRFAEMLGEVVTDSTKRNLELRIEAEHGACAGKTDIAKRAKERGYDAVHDSVHEMARDEARHCAGFRGLHKRFFG
jgi:rubrerythrin